MQIRILCLLAVICSLQLASCGLTCYAQEKIEEPIIVNGDTVEYSTDNKEVTATGNVIVNYKGTKLSCQKLTVNTSTKDAQAQGNVKIEEARGIIESENLTYNFEAKTAKGIDIEFRSYPYFGKAKEIQKISDAEFIAEHGYLSTCSYDNPHYRIKSKKVDFFTGDKIRTEGDTFYAGNLPIFGIHRYNHSLSDPLMDIQVSPGKNKDWGVYLLTGWRYNLTDNINGRVYLDYRGRLGLAEGFGLNYKTLNFGKGDFKFYYTQEKPDDLTPGVPQEYERHLIRWRHKWDIDKQTNLTTEFYKITDERRKILDEEHNFLKDYFYREFEKDSEPLSYVLFHHNFAYSGLDLLFQKRTNQWYDQLEKLPELKYTLPSLELGDSPIYFENSSSIANFNKKATTAPVTADEVNVARLDTINKFYLPMKVAFVKVSPFIGNRETFYDKALDGDSTGIRNIFYSGLEASTKFYRTSEVKTNFLGMDINGLRHIITPSIGYAYNTEPNTDSSNLKQIDSIDALNSNNSVVLELSNKLQTKRKGQSVDLVDFKVSTGYTFYAIDTLTSEKTKDTFSDFLFKIKLLPYAWMRIDADAIYNSEGDYFSDANYDANFNLGKERWLGFGQRYLRKGGNEITSNLKWRLNPKWAFSVYNRYQLGHDPALSRGLVEQEYSISRDLHCWTTDLTFNIEKNQGQSIWLVFRLNAFPELEFGFNQSYNKPSSGSQSNP
ncbi:MAG: LPS export ABC transporter periplasmic protein LptC [Candidatus Omnitrophica bacterium]|nr:LPS export ABC transporter periplasmic protein LptC [Candidatus Omnitrophota bacterium]